MFTRLVGKKVTMMVVDGLDDGSLVQLPPVYFRLNRSETLDGKPGKYDGKTIHSAGRLTQQRALARVRAA